MYPSRTPGGLEILKLEKFTTIFRTTHITTREFTVLYCSKSIFFTPWREGGVLSNYDSNGDDTF